MKKAAALTDEQKATLEKVYDHFGVTREFAFWKCVEMGCHYVQRVAELDSETYCRIAYSEGFWNWWTARWTAFDLDISKRLDYWARHSMNGPIYYYTAHYRRTEHGAPLYWLRRVMRPHLYRKAKEQPAKH